VRRRRAADQIHHTTVGQPVGFNLRAVRDVQQIHTTTVALLDRDGGTENVTDRVVHDDVRENGSLRDRDSGSVGNHTGTGRARRSGACSGGGTKERAGLGDASAEHELTAQRGGVARVLIRDLIAGSLCGLFNANASLEGAGDHLRAISGADFAADASNAVVAGLRCLERVGACFAAVGGLLDDCSGARLQAALAWETAGGPRRPGGVHTVDWCRVASGGRAVPSASRVKAAGGGRCGVARLHSAGAVVHLASGSGVALRLASGG